MCKIKIVSENNDKVKNMFDIYLILPGGTKTYLMPHRRDGILFNLLKDGITIDELKRLSKNVQNNKQVKKSPRLIDKFEKRIGYLIKCVDEYLCDE